MKTNQKPEVKEGRLPGFLRLRGILLQSVWTPETDEKRFLVGLPITCVLILGLGDPLGGYFIPASYALWCAAYVIRFRQRLKDRGELKLVIIAPTVFVGFLLCVRLY